MSSNKKHNFQNWSRSDDAWSPVGEVFKELHPGIYNVSYNFNTGAYLTQVDLDDTEVLPFQESVIGEIYDDAETFWNSEKKYNIFKLPYKRGMLLYGPPGNGKTSVIKLVCRQVIDRGGVAIKFTHEPNNVAKMLMAARQINPSTPIVVILEDIDAILEMYNKSEVINMIDGVDCLDKVLFLASTNYPEKLEKRVKNRPSRFDRRFKIPFPDENTRREYLNHLIESFKEKCENSDCADFKDVDVNIDVEQWVGDTNDISFSHLKELFISVVIFNGEYEDVLNDLKAMDTDEPDSDEEEDEVGFVLEEDEDGKYQARKRRKRNRSISPVSDELPVEGFN